ncbi:MAG: YhcH/YjgK/YiaL family protein [Opitutaceae bacterium]
MILDLLGQAERYRSLHPRLGRGLDWLVKLPAGAELGRHPIDGDDLYALVQAYDTGPAAEKRFESHRRNIDIQYVASGAETIFVAQAGAMKPVVAYDAENDILFYEDPPASTSLRCGAGSFAILFPEDAHKPGCLAGDGSPVRKIVVKVRI